MNRQVICIVNTFSRRGTVLQPVNIVVCGSSEQYSCFFGTSVSVFNVPLSNAWLWVLCLKYVTVVQIEEEPEEEPEEPAEEEDDENDDDDDAKDKDDIIDEDDEETVRRPSMLYYFKG